MKLDFDPTIPIYLQIVEEIKRQIVSGERQPGSRVETVRDLAQSMGVNPNTLQRAFAELEREGLMYSERTSGRYITTDQERIEKIRQASVRQYIADFVNLMVKSGILKQDIPKNLENFLKEEEQHG